MLVESTLCPIAAQSAILTDQSSVNHLQEAEEDDTY